MINLDTLNVAPIDWTWREGQYDLFERIAASTKKIVLVQAETGIGKSLPPLACLKHLGKRGIVLVQTKQLERQYLRDFDSMIMMQGRGNFTCEITGNAADQLAPCQIGKHRCEHMGVWETAADHPTVWPTCSYFLRKYQAREAQISIHNYAYWMAETGNADASWFNDIQWLVCDEAHELDKILMDAGSYELDPAYFPQIITPDLTPTVNDDIRSWVVWALDAVGDYKAIVGDLTETLETWRMQGNADPDAERELSREVFLWSQQYAAVRRLKNLKREKDFVLDGGDDGNTIRFRPIFGKYAFERMKNAAGEKLVLMSAFLAPEMLARTLGLDDDEWELIEPPGVFDRTLSPVDWLPVVKLNNKTSDGDWKKVIHVIDRLIDHFGPKKGFIHVPSYKVRNRIMALSQHADKLITYGARGEPTKEQAIERFINTDEQVVLLGQSISTGVDIPYHPQFNIIVKLAFMPPVDAVVKARHNVDKDFMPYHTICETVQATGRVKRAPDHDGPTIILDAQFGWFHASQHDNFPSWFEDILPQNSNGFPREAWSKYPNVRKSIALAPVRYKG
jgi:Rad3-related DNA helicase